MIQYLSTQMIETYHQKINERNKKASNIMIFITLACLILFIVFFTLYILDILLILVIPIIFGSLSVIMGAVWFLVKTYFISEKPLYTYLYPKIIEDIQYNDEYALKYEAYPKIKEILKASSLFSKFASNTTRAGFFFTTDSTHSVTIYDTYHYTQSNNSTVLHFNGCYVVIEGIGASPIQIRTKGKPSRSGVSFNKTLNEKKLKVFSADPTVPSNDEMMNVFNIFNNRLKPRNLFLSVLEGKLYLAVDLHKPIRKIQTLNKQTYTEVRENLLNLIATINEATSNK